MFEVRLEAGDTPGLPADFAEAIEWAKRRGVVLPDEFYAALEEHARGGSFTVSGLAGLDQIQAALDSLNQALESGETFEQWQARVGPLLGGLPDGRTETIFRNFMQQAYNAGRWKQFEQNKTALPYLMFSAVMDDRTTTVCRARNGIIRPVDDAFWATNSPQLHHRCRSVLIALSPAQANARSRNGNGLAKPEPPDRPEPGWGYRPSGEEVAAGLAAAIAAAAKNAPVGWLAAIIAFFTSGWRLLVEWLGRWF